MTDTPTPSEHDPIADAMRDARADVPPTSGEELVAAARGAKVNRARNRRRATGGALGAVAALLLVAVAVVALGDHPSKQVVKVGAPTEDLGAPGMASMQGKIAFGVVTVTPSTGLTDGQTVTVSATGFDAGTEVTFLECTPMPGTVAPPPSPDDPGGPVESPPSFADGSKSVPGNSGSGVAGSAGAPATAGGAEPGTPTESTDPVEPGALPDTATTNAPDEAAPGWRCADPDKNATRTKASNSDPEVESGHLTTATGTMSVTSSTGGFTAQVSQAGVIDVANESPALPTPTCASARVAPPSPEPNATPGDPGASPPPSAGSGADGTTSNEPSVGTATVEPSMGPVPEAEGTCMIIAVGMFDGTPTVYSSQPLSFGDDPTEPTSSVPTPTVVPPAPAPTAAQCPVTAPVPPAMTGDHTSPLLDFTPTSITICHIPVAELGPPPVTVTGPVVIGRITTALTALRDYPKADTACTMEMSDSMVLVAEAGSKRTAIVAEFFGCGVVSDGTTIRLGAKDLRWIYALTVTN